MEHHPEPTAPPAATVATPAQRRRVVATVVAAFADDPTFHYFFPEPPAFAASAAAFAGYLFDRRVGRGTVWTIDGGTAVAMWDAPASPSAPGSTADGARLDLPAATLDRLAAYDAVVRAELPATPHWYLGVLATHPDAAGRRWGRAVMAAGLDRAAATGLPAYLETTNPLNVRLYQRSGWTLSSATRLGGMSIWVLRRSA